MTDFGIPLILVSSFVAALIFCTLSNFVVPESEKKIILQGVVELCLLHDIDVYCGIYIEFSI